MGNRRKIYIVNRRYQWRFIAAFIGVSVIGIIAAVSVMLHSIHAGMEENLYRSHLKVSSTGQILLPILLKVNLPFFILGIIVIASISLYYSLKADNLIRNMTASLRELKKGNLDLKFGIGQEREFPNLESSFNNMIASNKSNISRLKIRSLELEDALKKFEGIKASEIDQKKDALRELREKAVALDEALSVFRLEDVSKGIRL
ncbi:MAG: hypothetical protein ACYDFU_09110 [Nitrospirota bacterium]